FPHRGGQVPPQAIAVFGIIKLDGIKIIGEDDALAGMRFPQRGKGFPDFRGAVAVDFFKIGLMKDGQIRVWRGDKEGVSVMTLMDAHTGKDLMERFGKRSGKKILSRLEFPKGID